MINVNVKPVFTSRKLSQTLSVKENKPPIVNMQCVVYSFQCDLCDANYVGFTTRHLHQRISEHRYSAIGRHLDTHHENKRTKISHLFKVNLVPRARVPFTSGREAQGLWSNPKPEPGNPGSGLVLRVRRRLWLK